MIITKKNNDVNIINYPNSFTLDIPKYKKGNKIHIKKENRGKFTDYCGGKVTLECISKGKRSNDPKIRKRATFADNARKWSKKHYNGGMVGRFDGGGTMPSGKDLSITILNTTNDPKGWIRDWYADRGDTWRANQAYVMLHRHNPEDYEYLYEQTSPKYFVDDINGVNEVIVPNDVMYDYSINLIGTPGIAALNTGLGEVIFSENSYEDPEIRIHELIHGADQRWRIPELYINNIMGATDPRLIFIDPAQQDNQYYDNPKEIYARLMQFRNKAGLDPKKIYTIEDVKSWRNSGKYDDEFLFNRYTDEFILQLLNDVAMNNNLFNSNVMYARKGIKLIPNSKYINKFSNSGKIEEPIEIPEEYIARLKNTKKSKLPISYNTLSKYVISNDKYIPQLNLNINPALDYVGNALESISGYEYEGNPLNKLGINMSFNLGTTGSNLYLNGIRFTKKFKDGGYLNPYLFNRHTGEFFIRLI